MKLNIQSWSPDQIFILCDTNSAELCLGRLLEENEHLQTAHQITIPCGDANKTIETASTVWKYLTENGANRHSLLINLGGGMITDLGGFVAATFKRGMPFINIPTTLLSVVDAATGGKTGVNFNGLKNEIGVFYNAEEVIVDVNYFLTLPAEQLLSGYGEMLKHALLSDKELWDKTIAYKILEWQPETLQPLLEENMAIKNRIVAEDPTEKGIRKALNLGHTAGHAIETLSHRKGAPIEHGHAIMWGLVIEIYLSVIHKNCPKEILYKLTSYAKENYGLVPYECKEIPQLIELMHHDKKNTGKEINFTYIEEIGKICINQTASEKDITEALEYLI